MTATLLKPRPSTKIEEEANSDLCSYVCKIILTACQTRHI
ncbi:MAG: hypothetical protein ACJAUT_001155 [Cellvibrionaceae bacterium]|jgi:hypothetical protein